jgi:hypothetical protein
METQTRLVLAVMAVLIVKHALFDFVLQTRFQLDNKHRYGHPGGLAHAGLHVLGSLPAVILARPAWLVGAAVLAAEFVLHYHNDWFKERWIRARGWTTGDRRFWAAFGVDQMLHALGYVAMAGVLVMR